MNYYLCNKYSMVELFLFAIFLNLVQIFNVILSIYYTSSYKIIGF